MFVLIEDLKTIRVKENAIGRLLCSSVICSTLAVIYCVLFINYSRVRVPLVCETKTNYGLIMTCSKIGVEGTIVYFLQAKL